MSAVDVLVCIKRVPQVGATIPLTDDGSRIDTRHLGFTVSPHEECAVEEAVRIVEAQGGSATVMTLGPDDAVEQLRAALALGVDRGVLLATEGEEWGPAATAAAIAAAVEELQAAGSRFDLLLFGNEAADTGDYQVGIRVAHLLGMACFTGVTRLRIEEGHVAAGRERAGWVETCRLRLPAVVTVKEGINLPRYPSLPGRLRARRAPITRIKPPVCPDGLRPRRLRAPDTAARTTRILGTGPAAAPAVVATLRELGILPP